MGFDKPFLGIYEWQVEHLMTIVESVKLCFACSRLMAVVECWIKGDKKRREKNARLYAYDSKITSNLKRFVHKLFLRFLLTEIN